MAHRRQSRPDSGLHFQVKKLRTFRVVCSSLTSGHPLGAEFSVGVWGRKFGVWGLRFGVWGLGVGVWDLGFVVQGFEFRVSGAGMRGLADSVGVFVVQDKRERINWGLGWRV